MVHSLIPKMAGSTLMGPQLGKLLPIIVIAGMHLRERVGGHAKAMDIGLEMSPFAKV